MYHSPAYGVASRLFSAAALPYVRSALTGFIGCLLMGSALALSLADLTNQDAARGIKGALDKGASSADRQARRSGRISRQSQGQDTAASGAR